MKQQTHLDEQPIYNPQVAPQFCLSSTSPETINPPLSNHTTGQALGRNQWVQIQ